jgi:aspartate racemase
MKKLGIIGGLGPMATARFLALITQMSQAAKDQDHIEILLHSRPGIPDRTAFITGQSDLNPEADLVSVGKNLANAGAEILAIPCFSAHYFIEAIRAEAKLPVIDAITETASCLKEAGIQCAGILATDGMIYSRLYQEKLGEAGIKALLPEKEEQKSIVRLIYDLKGGNAVDLTQFSLISQQLFSNGADVVLLGCSDLSILKCDQNLPSGYLDVLEVLARKAVTQCGRLRPEYEKL